MHPSTRSRSGCTRSSANTPSSGDRSWRHPSCSPSQPCCCSFCSSATSSEVQVPAHSSNRHGARSPAATTRKPDALPEPLRLLEGTLIVSCQAATSSPMRDTATMVRVARSALLGGARGLRVNGPEDVAAIKAISDVPIIGLFKEWGQRRNVITGHPEQAVQLAEAGADVVAVDATREVFEDIPKAVTEFRRQSGLPIMADVSTFDEGLEAWGAGAVFVGTTLSGYTPNSSSGDGAPDITLVEKLANDGVRVIAEGRYSTPEQVARAFDAGAFAVV